MGRNNDDTNRAMHVREHAVSRALQTEITGILFLEANDVSLWNTCSKLGSHDVQESCDKQRKDDREGIEKGKRDRERKHIRKRKRRRTRCASL